MGLFCWKKCQENRLAKLQIKQDAKTERTALRQETKQVGYLSGYDTGATGVLNATVDPLANLAGQIFGNPLNTAASGFSGSFLIVGLVVLLLVVFKK